MWGKGDEGGGERGGKEYTNGANQPSILSPIRFRQLTVSFVSFNALNIAWEETDTMTALEKIDH